MSLDFRGSAEPRRRHKRFAPPKTAIVCIPKGFWTSLLRKNVALHLKNLSLGGVQVVVDRALRPGCRTELTIEFPGFPDPVAAEAGVRWCRRDLLSLKPRWNAGLTFKRLDPDQEARLRAVDRTYLG